MNNYPIGSYNDSKAPWNESSILTSEEYEQYQDEKDYFTEWFYSKD